MIASSPGASPWGAAVPLAYKALRSKADLAPLKRFGIGFGSAVAGLVVLSVLVFGYESWHVFVTRIGRHSDVYYTMHIGLKKVITWRDWVASQNFHGHVGLQRFHDWNLRLRHDVGVDAVARHPRAARGRRGIVRRLGAPAAVRGVAAGGRGGDVLLLAAGQLLLRGAGARAGGAPARGDHRAHRGARLRDWVVLCGFVVFWLTTLMAPRMFGDDIVYDHFICVALLLFLAGWIVAWLPWQGVLARVKARSASKGGASSEPAAQTPAA